MVNLVLGSKQILLLDANDDDVNSYHLLSIACQALNTFIHSFNKDGFSLSYLILTITLYELSIIFSR